MEQQYSEPGAAMAQAARTVLPGEPFEAPMSSQVPAPREDEVPVHFLQPAGQPQEMAAPAWNYDSAAPAAPAGYPAPDAAGQYVPAAMAGANAFETLQDYASLPTAGEYPPPAAAQAVAPVFAPAGYPQQQPQYPQQQVPQYPQQGQPVQQWPTAAAIPGQAYGAPYPGMPADQQMAPAPMQTQTLPPLATAPLQEEKAKRKSFQFGSRNKAPKSPSEPKAPKDPKAAKVGIGAAASGKKAPDKRLIAAGLVAVLGAGGYFGYTTFVKKSDSTTTPAATTPVVPAAVTPPAYAFPTNLAGFTLQKTPAATKMAAAALASAKKISPQLAKTMTFASYSAGLPSIVSLSFHPVASQLAADYYALLKFTAAPSKGDVAYAAHSAVPGAAGGVVACGGEAGAHASSYCVWRGATTVGVMQVSGSPKSQITEILTRELRAYAEH